MLDSACEMCYSYKRGRQSEGNQPIKAARAHPWRIQGASRRSLLMKRVSPYKVRAVRMFIHQMALWTKDGPPVPPPSHVCRSPPCCTASARKHTHIIDVFLKAKALTRETSICPSPYIRALRTLLHGLIGCCLTLSSDATGINNPPKSSALN
jgi:hypothetical protein